MKNKDENSIVSSWVLFAFLLLGYGASVHSGWVLYPGSSQNNTFGFLSQGPKLFAATDSGVYRSVDTGNTWTLVMPERGARSIVLNGSAIYVGVMGVGVLRSEDQGETWSILPRTGGLPNDVKSIVGIGPYVLAGSYSSGLYRWSDGASIWTQVGVQCVGSIVNKLAARENVILAASSMAGSVCLSADSGATWSKVYSNSAVSLLLNDFFWYAGSASRLVRSADGGMTWEVANPIIDTGAFSLFSYGSVLLAGIRNGGIFVSQNDGESWLRADSVPTSSTIEGLHVYGGYVFAGATFWQGPQGIWRRPLSEFPTALSKSRNISPTRFTVSRTEARFMIQVPARVTLKIHSLSGREVATLLSESLPAGEHVRPLPRHALPEGVYVYRLQAGSLIESKKMMMSGQ